MAAAEGGAKTGVLERNEKKAFLDDTTPLSFTMLGNRIKPKESHTVSTLYSKHFRRLNVQIHVVGLLN